MIQRYDISGYDVEVSEWDKGAYCRYEDVAKLEAENAELRKKLAEKASVKTEAIEILIGIFESATCSDEDVKLVEQSQFELAEIRRLYVNND